MGVFLCRLQQTQHNCKMRSSLVLLVCLAVLLSLFLPAIEAAAARRRGKAGRRGVANRGRQQGRRGRVASGRSRQLGRRGRQDGDVAAADPNAVDAEAEEEIYNGCDPATNIGGFLIQKLWRKKCAELEYTNFGGYGGIPVEEEEGEEE